MDLKKFRKIAAGDRLRGQYQGLSQDPNSLSNLDQVSLVNTFRDGYTMLLESKVVFSFQFSPLLGQCLVHGKEFCVCVYMIFFSQEKT